MEKFGKTSEPMQAKWTLNDDDDDYQLHFIVIS